MEMLELMRRLHAALNTHDSAAVGACVADDVEIQGPTGELHGRDAIEMLSQTFMTAFPDNEWVIYHQIADGDTVAIEYVMEGTHTGTLQTPLGALVPTGKRIVMRAAAVSRVREDEVYSTHMYWDNLALMSALGIVPVAARIPAASAFRGKRWEPISRHDASEADDMCARLHEALNAHDLEAAVALIAPDVEVVAPTVEANGADAMRTLIGLYLAAFPDIKWHVMHHVSDGDTTVTEQLVEGTHGGHYATEQGEFTPTGNTGITRVCQVLRVRNNLIESVHLYWDHLVLMQTMGAFA
jgi:ketosteroid isomerase-like protein